MDLAKTSEVEYAVFKHPSLIIIAGPTMSGKTTLIKQLLEHNQTIFDVPPTKIYYFYSIMQPLFKEFTQISPEICFINDSPSQEHFDAMSASDNNLIILDDLMETVGHKNDFIELVTKMIHHKSLSVIYITQNFFHQAKNSVTINKNVHYLFICNNPADRLTASIIGRKAFPGQAAFFREVHEDAVENRNYGYLLLDFHQATPNKLRLLTDIFDVEKRVYYVKK